MEIVYPLAKETINDEESNNDVISVSIKFRSSLQ